MNRWSPILPSKARAALIATAWCVLSSWTHQAAAQVADDCLSIKKVLTSSDSLRQGSDLDVQVIVTASGCFVPVPAAGEGLPSRVELKSDSHLQARLASIDFFRIERISQGPPVSYGARESTLHLRFTAAQDAALGIHHSSFLLNYDTTDPTGRAIPRSIELEVPVNVVAHDAPVKMRSSAPKWNPAQILLIPFRAIQLIFTWDGC
jgi:hypothetical protein